MVFDRKAVARTALALALLAAPRHASAEPPPLVAVPAGEDKISALREGQPAPNAGQLFDNPTAIRWANYLQQCHLRLDIDVAYQKRLDGADLTLAKRTAELEQQRADAVMTDLRVRVAKAEEELRNPAFYHTVGFGIAVGVLAAVAVGAGTAALLSAAK